MMEQSNKDYLALERQLVGALIVDPAAVLKGAALSPQHFLSPPARAVWSMAIRLDRDGDLSWRQLLEEISYHRAAAKILDYATSAAMEGTLGTGVIAGRILRAAYAGRNLASRLSEIAAELAAGSLGLEQARHQITRALEVTE